jgi:hypothetical protein
MQSFWEAESNHGFASRLHNPLSEKTDIPKDDVKRFLEAANTANSEILSMASTWPVKCGADR